MLRRAKILQQARSWLGTPFHHQGRIKQHGCDCIGLIIGVAKALSIRSKETNKPLYLHDKSNYPRIATQDLLPELLTQHCYKAPELKLGNIVLFRLNRLIQHVGIISDYVEGHFGLIHAYYEIGAVVEHHLNAEWLGKISNIYSFWEAD